MTLGLFRPLELGRRWRPLIWVNAFAGMSGVMVLLLALPARAEPAHHRWGIVIHGGAGVIERAKLTPEMEAAYRKAMAAALERGTAVLKAHGSSLDAITAVITGLEDDPLFNAGRGAVFTAEGRNELDAAIMDGATLKAGAVAGLTRTRHPILLARAVMEKSPHVMLIGEGAEAFSQAQGLEQVPPSFFFTERRWQGLVKELKAKGWPIPPRPSGAPPEPKDHAALWPDDHRFGTVGVVAVDEKGDIAAGTSTGGVTAKRWGRVGDSPVIGAGTYADNRSCAVSGTGTGEYFIRLTVARTICALVQYQGMSLQAAADRVVKIDLPKIGGPDTGGVIAATVDGQLVWSFNTTGMYRARQAEGGKAEIAIFADEP